MYSNDLFNHFGFYVYLIGSGAIIASAFLKGIYNKASIVVGITLLITGISTSFYQYVREQDVKMAAHIKEVVHNIKIAYKSYQDISYQAVMDRGLGDAKFMSIQKPIIVGTKDYLGVGLSPESTKQCIQLVSLLNDQVVRVVVRDKHVIFTQDGVSAASFLPDVGGIVIKDDEHGTINVDEAEKACQVDNPMIGLVFK